METSMRELLIDHLQSEIAESFELWRHGKISIKSFTGLLGFCAAALERIGEDPDRLRVSSLLGPHREFKRIALQQGQRLKHDPMSSATWRLFKGAVKIL